MDSTPQPHISPTSTWNLLQPFTKQLSMSSSQSENGASSAPSKLNAPPSRRRDKPQLSCNLCRRRKLRCDRQHPCSSCSSRAVICTYVERPTKGASSTSSVPRPAVVSMHDRLVQLERLVLSLSPGPNHNSSPVSTSGLGSAPGLSSNAVPTFSPCSVAPSSSSTPVFSSGEHLSQLDVVSECGSMCVSGSSKPRYVGGDHWAAILDSIADLKHQFNQEETIRQNYHDIVDTDDDTEVGDLCAPTRSKALLLYGCPLPISRADVVAALPPKSAVDRYISRYFNRLELVHFIIHGPTFLREYDEFWIDQSGAPILWIGLLFSMICLALLASDASDTAHGDPEHRSLQIQLYREKTVQCLIMGNYTRSGPYVLETLAHYIYIEMGIKDDTDEDIWYLFAVQVNLAMRMGYHRDPSNFQGISPLQSEMRRRVWAMILQADILVSSQMGMPRMISDWKCDTKEPLNVNDSDLDNSAAELPSPRPETEFTSTLGVIARRRMYVALGAVLDLTSLLQPCSYAEIMRVDGILNEAAASIPQPLKPRPLANSVTDKPEVIMARLFIEQLHYKGQIMLHRRYLHAESPSKAEDMFAYSRMACLDASLGALRIQNMLDEETSPGGQLHMMRWRVSSIMNQTFLTATMILCWMIDRSRTLDREDEILTALKRARTTWMRASHHSKEAKKAAETVSIVMARASERRGGGGDHLDGWHEAHSMIPTTNLLSTDSGSNSDVDRFFAQDLFLQDIQNSVSNAFQESFRIPGILDHQEQMLDFLNSPSVDSTGPALDNLIQMNDEAITTG